MKPTITFFSLLLCLCTAFSQNSFDITFPTQTCGTFIQNSIETEEDYVFLYRTGNCSNRNNYILKMSKNGVVKDSIPTFDILGMPYSATKLIKVKNHYYIFGYMEQDSLKQYQMVVLKLNEQFKLESKTNYILKNTTFKGTGILSVKINKKQDQFYFVLSRVFEKNGFIGTLDTSFNAFKIKDVSKNIVDLFDITETIDEKGYLITTYDKKYKTDANFTTFEPFIPNLMLLQSHNIKPFGNKYIVVGETSFAENNNDLQRDIKVVLLNQDLSFKKSVRIGKMIGQDTADKNTPEGLFVRDNNTFFLLGITYANFENNHSWANLSMLDSNLNVKFTKYFKQEANTFPLSLIETQDKSLLFCGGKRYLNNIGLSRSFVTKVKIQDLLTTDVAEPSFVTPVIQLYPNPASTMIHIDFEEYDNRFPIKIDIFDMLGRQILSQSWNYPTKEIDVSSLPKGLYNCRIALGNHVIKNEKFVKQ